MSPSHNAPFTFAPSPRRGEGWGEGRVLAGTFLSRRGGVDGAERSAVASWPAYGRGFAPLPGRELLSLACPRESSQREGHPGGTPSGLPARKVREMAVGFFDRASCPDEKLAGIRAGHPAGFSTVTSPRPRGPGKSSAHPCAHSWCARCASAEDAGFSHFALGGPLCGGEARTTRPAGESARMPTPFRQDRDVLSKSPDEPHAPGGHRPAGAVSGCRSLWLLSLGQARESDSLPGRGAKLRPKAGQDALALQPRRESLGDSLRSPLRGRPSDVLRACPACAGTTSKRCVLASTRPSPQPSPRRGEGASRASDAMPQGDQPMTPETHDS
jgi:hypothetical protein